MAGCLGCVNAARHDGVVADFRCSSACDIAASPLGIRVSIVQNREYEVVTSYPLDAAVAASAVPPSFMHGAVLVDTGAFARYRL